MIIYFCTSTFASSGNGPSKFAKLLLDLNTKDNIEFHVFTEDIPSNFESNRYVHKINIRSGFLYNKLGMILRIKDYKKGLIPYIKRKKPDVIVFNNAILGLGLYRAGIPSIGMINDYNSIECLIKEKGLTYSYIRLRIFRLYEINATRLASIIICNSKYLGEKLINSYNVDKKKVKLLYKSIETNIRIKPSSHSINNKIEILFVKSDFRRGGIEDLIQACNNIDMQILLHIVGPTGIYFDKIRAFRTSQKLKLKFHGQLPQESVFKLLKKVDIFCTPSRQEALGVANMEAMIYKVPIVYTKIGGIPEVMNWGKNGFQAEPSDPDSLKNAIVSCITNSHIRNEKIDNAYQFVKTHFSKSTMLTNFINICKDATNS